MQCPTGACRKAISVATMGVVCHSCDLVILIHFFTHTLWSYRTNKDARPKGERDPMSIWWVYLVGLSGGSIWWAYPVGLSGGSIWWVYLIGICLDRYLSIDIGLSCCNMRTMLMHARIDNVCIGQRGGAKTTDIDGPF